MRRTLVLVLVLMGAAGTVATWLAFHSRRIDPGSSGLSIGVTDMGATQSGDLTTLEPIVSSDLPRVAITSDAVQADLEPVARMFDQDAGALVIRVVSKVDRTPLAKVRVTVLPPESMTHSWEEVSGTQGDLTHSPISDAQGQVEIDLPPHIGFSVSARGEDGQSGSCDIETLPLNPGERREIVLELPTGNDAFFYGRVLDRETGLPVERAKVALMRSVGWTSDEGEEGSSSATPLTEISTDSAGSFDLSLASWMNPFLRIEADGYGLVLAAPHVGHDGPDRAQDINVSRAASLDARVVDRSGKPIPETSVKILVKGYNLVTGGDQDEQFGWGLDVVPDERWRAALDDQGRCTIAGLPANVPLEVQVRQGARVLRRDAEAFKLKPGERLARQWTIGSGCRLEGLAIDQHSNPMELHDVWLMKREWPGEKYAGPYENASIAGKAMTNGRGEFILEDVAPGTWWLCAAPTREYRGSPIPGAIAPKTQSVEVGSGGTQTVILKVVRGLYIRGHVHDPGGTPVAEASVGSRQEHLFDNTHTKEDGSFALGPLALGTCTLWADGPGDAASSERITVEPGQEGVVLRLRAGGALSGRVVDSATGLPSRASVHVRPDELRDATMGGFMTGSNDDGTFRLEGLEPGSYHLLFGTEDGRFATLSGIAVVANKESSGHVALVSPGGKLKLMYQGKHAGARFTIVHQKAMANFPSLT